MKCIDMRKIFSTLILSLCSLAIFAQYEPNTHWPYIYENFTKGTIFMSDNQKSDATLNIHLWGNVLHYVNSDGRIFQTEDKGVVRVEIGSDAYIFSDHHLVKIISTKGTNLLVKQTKADFDRLQTATGAYGADLNSSAVKSLSSLELGGLDKPELGKMLQEKADGTTLVLNDVYYFIIKGLQIEANKKAVEKYLTDSKSSKATEWKTFLKQNKIKWKSEDDLINVLNFISE
jgi:hypothetical protein